MKPIVKFSILIISMLVLGFAMITVGLNLVLPWLLSQNDGTILCMGIIFSGMLFMLTWVGIGEFLMRKLNCTDIIYEFLGADDE